MNRIKEWFHYNVGYRFLRLSRLIGLFGFVFFSIEWNPGMILVSFSLILIANNLYNVEYWWM